MNDVPSAPSNPVRPVRFRSLNVLLLSAGLGAAAFAVMWNPADPAPVVALAPSPMEEVTAFLDQLPKSDSGQSGGLALRNATGFLRSQPDKANAWLQAGDVLAQAQRETLSPAWIPHAAEAYQTALRIKPDLTPAMTGLAWVHGARHEFDLSILWAEKALARDPDHAAAHGILGDAAVELGDYDKASLAYQKMMDLKPDLSSWSRGAWLLWLTGQTSRATTLMQQAIRSGGPFAENTSWCRARLAMMFFHDGALVPAAQALEPALKLADIHPHVLLAAGKIEAARGNLTLAEQHYQKAQETHPGLEALAALGDLCAAQGKQAEAQIYYGKVEALHQSHRETGLHDHLEMARFYADHNLKPEVALRLALEHGAARTVYEWDTLAWVYFRNGDQQQAIPAMKNALKTGTPDPVIHYHAGCIAAAAGDHSSARRHLQRALGMNPGFCIIQASATQRLLEECSRPGLVQDSDTSRGLTEPPVLREVKQEQEVVGKIASE